MCRDQTHDDFHHFERITSDPSASPYLDFETARSVRRVVQAKALRRVFSPLPDSFDGVGNVHGKFGNTEDWPKWREQIRRWLSEATDIEQIEARLCQYTGLGSNDQAELGLRVRKGLDDALDEAVANPPYQHEDLSGLMANASMLPMFGLPIRVRSLYSRGPRNPRELEVAQVADPDITAGSGAPLRINREARRTFGRLNQPGLPPAQLREVLAVRRRSAAALPITDPRFAA